MAPLRTRALGDHENGQTGVSQLTGSLKCKGHQSVNQPLGPTSLVLAKTRELGLCPPGFCSPAEQERRSESTKRSLHYPLMNAAEAGVAWSPGAGGEGKGRAGKWVCRPLEEGEALWAGAPLQESPRLHIRGAPASAHRGANLQGEQGIFALSPSRINQWGERGQEANSILATFLCSVLLCWSSWSAWGWDLLCPARPKGT